MLTDIKMASSKFIYVLKFQAFKVKFSKNGTCFVFSIVASDTC